MWCVSRKVSLDFDFGGGICFFLGTLMCGKSEVLSYLSLDFELTKIVATRDFTIDFTISIACPHAKCNSIPVNSI